MNGGTFGSQYAGFGATGGWSAEMVWNISGLLNKGQPLIAGHAYRAEIILHDGDRDGDIGEACVNISA